jgi:hypothetical protein
MQNQPQNFSTEKRRAKDPNNPPGGSTAIRGRQPTVQATGFMITDHYELPTPTPAEPAPIMGLPPSLPAATHQGPALVSREEWMLFDDDRSDQRADADWTAANAILLPISSSVTDTPPVVRLSFFDEEYTSGRRVPSPTDTQTGPPVISQRTAGPPDDIARLRDRINRALSLHVPMPNFPGARIPATATFNPSVHAAMTDLVQRRDRCEHELHLMVHDEAADGTPLDPQRNYEPEYERFSERIIECNRQLYTIYARYLDRPSRPLLLQPEASVQQPADSANMAVMLPSPTDIHAHTNTSRIFQPPCQPHPTWL